MRRSLVMYFILVPLAGATTRGEELTLATAPPVVVKTEPQAGTADVDPNLKEIRVTFSKEMNTGGFSVVQASQPTMPKIRGRPRYDKDKRTLILPVELESGKSYVLWLNTERFRNCKDSEGRPAVPYLLVFQTKGKAAAAAANPVVSPELLARAYDALCDDMALHYSYFALKGIDWDKIRQAHRSRAIAAKSERDFIGVLTETLAELHDGHVWIFTGGEQIGTYMPPRPRDSVNRESVFADLKERKQCGEFAVVGRTHDEGFGALILTHQSAGDSAAAREVVGFIRDAHDAPGFLIDLRTANGGDESLAGAIAREFCAQETVYARSKYRNGPAPTEFTRDFERTVKAVEKPYTKPVVCLIGPGCVSSGEGFAKMLKCLPQVTMVGSSTRGSSGNPKPFVLPGLDVHVWYSRWVDMLPDGTPVEGRGIAPDVRVDAASAINSDAGWDRARQVLKDKVARIKG